MGRDEVILCQCCVILESEVIACARRGARTLAEIAAGCDAGTGCGSCRGAITTILEEEEARRRRAEGLPEALLRLPLFAGSGKGGVAGSGEGGAGKKPAK
jgi:NAD(P)H-nitrite reductase large subunit